MRSTSPIFLTILMLAFLIPHITNGTPMGNPIQTSNSSTTKIDYKVLNMLQSVDRVGANFNTIVDMTLVNSHYVQYIPNDTVVVYSNGDIVGVVANHDQIMNLAGLDFVSKITAPNGVFPHDANVSMENPPSPFEQYKNGIVPTYVKCKYGFDLLLRQVSSNDNTQVYPACFTWNDEVKAQNRGTGKIVNNMVKTRYWDLYGVLPTKQSFFMNSNSTAHVYVEYFPYFKNNLTRDLKPYVTITPDVDQSNSTQDVSISANQTAIQDTVGKNSTVVYTITSTAAKGLYWIHIPQEGCGGNYPLAVGLELSEVSSADVATYLGPLHCPSIDMGSHMTKISNLQTRWLVSEPYFN